ncbi:MAG: CpaF family protein [Anaerolineales bacterium]|nr:CpaF family protein [Anaerolineales bacterium]
MPIDSEESVNSLDDGQVRKIFHDLHTRLNISVDFDSYEPGGLQFWSQLESDLVRILEIDSINDIESATRNLSVALGRLVKEEQLSLTEPELDDLLNQLVDHYFGLGMLDVLLRDDSIYEIFVNNFQEIYFGSKGKMQRAPFSFLNEAHLQHVVDRLCARNNAPLPSDKNPVTTFALLDNSTVIILFPPVTPNSPSVSIRRVVRKPITIEQLVKWGSVSADMLQFLKASVEARLNILVCGYQGAGADTIVNVLSSFVPGDERVISIEYENNYSLRINHLIKLIAQNDLMDENSFIKLLALTGKLRGDRLFLGEFLFSDAYDALTNVSDNFSGSLLRVVAKSPADAVNRLETFIQLDKPNLPRTKIGNLICSSIDLIVYQERLSDGTRVIKEIVEVLDETNRDGQVLLKELYGVYRA